MTGPTVFGRVFADKDLLALLKYCWRVTNYLVNRTAQEAVKSGHIRLDHVKVKADLLICHYKQHLAGGMAGKVQVSYYEWPSFLDPSPVSWGDDLVNTEGVVVMAQMLSTQSSTIKSVKLCLQLSALPRNTYEFLFEALGQCGSLKVLTIQERDPTHPQTPRRTRTVQEKLFQVIRIMPSVLSLVWEGNATEAQGHVTHDGSWDIRKTVCNYLPHDVTSLIIRDPSVSVQNLVTYVGSCSCVPSSLRIVEVDVRGNKDITQREARLLWLRQTIDHVHDELRLEGEETPVAEYTTFTLRRRHSVRKSTSPDYTTITLLTWSHLL